MNPAKDPGCALDSLERVRFFPRQLVTPEDLNDQVAYVVDKLRRHNRFVHGFGIACGLEVTRPCRDPQAAWRCEPDKGYDRVTIHPGYALTPCGDEVHVTTPLELDLTREILSGTSDCAPQPDELATKKFYLALRAVSRPTRPVRVASANCGCGDAPCEFSRVREDFEYGLLGCEPAIYPLRRDFWKADRLKPGQAPPCWNCAEDDWVVIAELTLTTDSLRVEDNRRYVLPSVLATALVAASL